METNLKLKLLDYISKKSKEIDSAFTLVELIVVVVIIGILSSIAVPAFRNASDKARQKEASTLIATYVKAAQAYNTETGNSASNAEDLNQYIAITECAAKNTTTCKNAVPTTVTSGTNWGSPSGAFNITMSAPDGKTLFVAESTGDPQGRGVSGCYNNSTGSSKVLEMSTEGNVTPADC